MRDFDNQSLRTRIEGLTPDEALGVAVEAYDTLRADLSVELSTKEN